MTRSPLAHDSLAAVRWPWLQARIHREARKHFGGAGKERKGAVNLHSQAGEGWVSKGNRLPVLSCTARQYLKHPGESFTSCGTVQRGNARDMQMRERCSKGLSHMSWTEVLPARCSLEGREAKLLRGFPPARSAQPEILQYTEQHLETLPGLSRWK